MALRFRKSVKLGPIRLNLSKSGIGASVGVKGARISKKAGGGYRTTLSMPGTGLSEVQDFSEPKAKEAGAVDLKAGAAVAVSVVLLALFVVSCSSDAPKQAAMQEPAAVEAVEPVAETAAPAEEAAQPTEETPVEEIAEVTEPAPTEEASPAPEAPAGTAAPVEEAASAEPAPTEKTVYVAASGNGKRYHYDPDCAGTEVKSLPKSQAESIGYTPCKKCAGG